MLHLSAITRLPLEVLEIGASAGLNLAFDEYRYELGDGRTWGPADAPLTVECLWRGSTPPLDAPLAVVARAGCDLRPVDPANAEDRARLISYVWADQLHRLATDQGLRTSLIGAGHDVAARFTWAACARQHLAVYDEVLEAPGALRRT